MENKRLSNIPISTQWLMENTTTNDSEIINAVVLVANNSTSGKGTGWLVSNQHIITNEHVIRGAKASDIQLFFSDGSQFNSINLISDSLTDLAVLTLKDSVSVPPLKINEKNIEVGTKLCTWGHPLGYSGPSPILTVGYLSGFNTHQPVGLANPQKRLILNAALNGGNSGGPIIEWGQQSVLGVAVTKHSPMSSFLKSAIQALTNNNAGVVFEGHDAQGRPISFVESQLVAEVLQYFRSMTQVVIGEAISIEDLIIFLNKNRIPWIKANG